MARVDNRAEAKVENVAVTGCTGEGLNMQKSYVLRFWRAQQGDSWRVTLIPIGPDLPEQHFTTIVDFLAHLSQEYAAPSGLTHGMRSVPLELGLDIPV